MSPKHTYKINADGTQINVEQIIFQVTEAMGRKLRVASIDTRLNMSTIMRRLLADYLKMDDSHVYFTEPQKRKGEQE